MRAAYLNRSFCYMKLFKINEAISDCDHCIAQMQTEIVDGDSQKELSSSRLQLAKIKTRKAICLAWKGSLQSAKQLLAEVQNEELP